MCLDTSVPTATLEEGVGYKCFRNYQNKLVTMLQYIPVERGAWVTNPRPNEQIGFDFRTRYRSGFHILTEVEEAYLYLAHEYGFKRCPWRVSSSVFEIFPVRYKNAHTRGAQYDYKVVVADDIYILTADEIRTFEFNRSYMEG